jgi:penicillin-binding protein 2
MRTGKIVTQHSQAFTFTRRALLLGSAQAGVATLLAARMAWLAIAENERYSLLAESNRVQLTIIMPRRGWIVDRHGKPIAINRADFRVDLIPSQVHDVESTIHQLQKMLSLPQEEIDRIHEDLVKAADYQPVQIASNLDYDKFATISLRAPDMPGVMPGSGTARYYPTGAAVAHLVGYVGAASAADYEKTHDPLLVTPGFKVGKDGLERTMELWLRGRPGAKRSEVTAHGKLVRELTTRPETVGHTLQLTIDAGLQEYVARRLGTNSGSAVVIDTTNGDVLAFVSMPAYDPNSFSDGISHSEWNMLSSNDHVPLMNKALQGLYPPGSTVKPMNGLALLAAGVDPKEHVFCAGALRVGNGIFHCHKRHGHGPLDLKHAIMQSCDIYFYEMVRRLGYDRVAPIARMMGLGQKFDLPYSTQRFGTVPDSIWKKRRYKTDWTVADSLNAAIGQGYVLANPLQLAVMASRIASGRNLSPRLIVNRRYPPQGGPLPLDPEHLQRVRDAMYGVVNEGGTGGAARLQVPGASLAAKTGTAQVRRISMSERSSGVLKNAALPFKLRDHALFICFGPTEQPRYAAGIVLEHNGHTVRNLDTPMIGRDIVTYMLDRERALASLAEIEPSWGGDIAARMRADAARWQAEQLQPAEASAGNATVADDPE